MRVNLDGGRVAAYIDDARDRMTCGGFQYEDSASITFYDGSTNITIFAPRSRLVKFAQQILHDAETGALDLPHPAPEPSP